MTICRSELCQYLELGMTSVWQASDARHRFTDLVDAAVDGGPQVVKCRDGRQVVVVPMEYFEKTRLKLKTYLLSEGFAEDEDDAFDRALRDIRTEGSPFIEPAPADLSE
jgi:prevent-host-death family protein